MICSATPSAAYLAALELVLRNGDTVFPRGKECREVQDLTVLVEAPSEEPLKTRDPFRDHKTAKYLDAEFELYRRREDKAEEFAKHAPFWREVANPDGTVNSCYGKIVWGDETVGRPPRETCKECGGHGGSYAPGDGGMEVACHVCDGVGSYTTHHKLTPWEWARQALETDKDTRQAVLLFMRPDHLFPCKDVVCTMHGQFSIRRGRLNLSMVMRSNDLVKGFAYDAPWFMHLQATMFTELLETYPDLRLGWYRHTAHSAHVYSTDYDKAWAMIGKEPPREPTQAEESLADADLDRLHSLFGG